MALSDAFVWGANGQPLTQAEIDRRRAIADALMKNAIDYSPVASWTQGAARVAQGIIGALDDRSLDRSQKAGQDSAAADFAAALGGSGISPSTLAAPGSTAATSATGATPSAMVPGSSSSIAPGNANDIQTQFLDTVKNGYDVGGTKLAVTNPYGLAAVAATGQAESGYSPQNAGGTWADGKNPAGGIMSWNGPRLANLQKFAGGNNGTPQQQGQFFLQENPDLITALNNAKSVQEAQSLMNNAWAFKGYNVPGNANAAHRLALANGYLPQFQGSSSPAAAAIQQQAPIGGQQVASLDPAAGVAPPVQTPAVPPFDPATVTPDQLQAALGPTTPYQDPQVTTDYRAPATGGTAPAATPVQQVAQAMTATPSAAQPINQQAIVKALSNPFISKGQQAVLSGLLASQQARAQALYEQQLKQSDPMYQIGLRKAQYEADNLGRVTPDTQAQIDAADRTAKFNAQQAITLADHNQALKAGDPLEQANVARTNAETSNLANTNDIKEYNFAKQNGYTGSFPDYQIALKAAGRPTTTINNGDNSSKFQAKADEEAATRIGGYITDGTTASRMLGDVQQLADLGAQINTGKGAQVMAALGPYAQALGIDVKGLGEAQAYQAVIDRMAPNMRPTGAGSSSDTDVKMFLNSLPSLGNVPGGNQIITQTLAAIQQQKIAAAQIAQKAVMPKEAGGISWQEAEQQIRDLGNPYENFNKYRQALSQNGSKQLPSDNLTVPTTIPGVTIRKKN